MCIALSVLGDLSLPEFDVRRREATLSAIMAVPETAVNEDGRRILRQHDVGFARKIFAVKAKSKAESVEIAAKADFGLRVLGSDTGHNLASFGLVENVGHSTTPERFPSDRSFRRGYRHGKRYPRR